MNCTRCKKPIKRGQPYGRTKRGAHHFKCALLMVGDAPPNISPKEFWDEWVNTPEGMASLHLGTQSMKCIAAFALAYHKRLCGEKC